MRHETLILLKDTPANLPARNGKRINLSTIYRWVNRGRVGVKLETVIVGGQRYTSLEALQRFDESIAKSTAQPTQNRSASSSLVDTVNRAAKRKLPSLGSNKQVGRSRSRA